MSSGPGPQFVDDESGVPYCKSLRKYNQDEDVLQEAPIVTFVNVDSDSTFLTAVDDSSSQNQHICLTCCVTFNMEESSKVLNKCKKCDWIFCSFDCMTDQRHAELECPVFKKNSIPQQRYVYEFLAILRTTRLKNSCHYRTQWNNILKLSNHWNKRILQYESLYERSTEFLNHKCNSKIKKEVIVQLVNFLKSKSFKILNFDSEGKRYFGAALYNLTSMIEHSCSSNCDWTLLPNKSNEKWWIKIKAKRYIDTQEKLTISCISMPNVFVGTQKRREILYRYFGFHCTCDLCIDPSEFDTNMSALMCSEIKCDGFLLPVKINEKIHIQSSWKCHKCQKEMPFEEVKKIIMDCESQLTNILERKTGTEILPLLEDCIEKWTGKVLYPNHYLILQAEFYWAKAASLSYTLDYKNVGRKTAILIIERALKCRVLLQHIVFGWNNITAELDLFLGQGKLYLSMQVDSPEDNQDEKTRIAIAAKGSIQKSLIYYHSSLATWKNLPSSRQIDSWRSLVENWINVANVCKAEIDKQYQHRKP